jgi:hypothetical protein
MFEVSRRSLGKAGMCWSQPARVDNLRKKWRAGRKKIQKKWEQPNRRRCRALGHRPLSGDQRSRPGNQALTAGRRQLSNQGSPPDGRWPKANWQPTVACRPRVDTCACHVVPNFFNYFKFLKKGFLEVWEMGQGF